MLGPVRLCLSTSRIFLDHFPFPVDCEAFTAAWKGDPTIVTSGLFTGLLGPFKGLLKGAAVIRSHTAKDRLAECQKLTL